MKVMLPIFAALLLIVVAVAAWRGGLPLVTEGFKRGGKETLVLLPLLAVERARRVRESAATLRSTSARATPGKSAVIWRIWPVRETGWQA